MRQLGDVLTCALNEGRVLNTDWRLIRTPEDWEAYLDTLEYDSLAIDPAEYPVFVHSHEAIDSREDPYMHHTFMYPEEAIILLAQLGALRIVPE